MDPNFAFPPRPKPTPRPAPSQSPAEPVNRESNALRASVLDAALQLGFGTNNTVANWMFNNTLDEEEELADEDTVGRDPLSATSEEYAPYSTPPTSTSSHSETFHAGVASPVSFTSAENASPSQVHFPSMPAVSAAPPSLNKLRKPRRDGGYESDGGYISDGGKKARVRTKSKTKKDPTHAPISEPVELVALTKEEMKRMKKAGKHHDASLETDGEDIGKPAKSKSPKSKKNKKSSSDAAAGYETDDGYVSSSGKPKKGRRFFSLRKKSDSASEPVVEPVPPMPEREVFTLPIASRFATTMSRPESPLVPPSRPFLTASGSSSPSLSSSANSPLTPSDREGFGMGSLSLKADVLSPESYNGGHTPDKSINSTHTVTPASQDSVSSRFASPQTASPRSKILISYPLTRTPSADEQSQSQASQDSSLAKPMHVPSPISLSSPELNTRAPSPSPMGSPFVVLTPLNTGPPSRAISPVRSSIVIPSSDYIVPSRSGSPLPPSPNVLAYYDVSPPSPPPTGPLPRPPPSSSRDIGPGVQRLRSLSQDRGGHHSDQRPVSPNPRGAHSPVSAGGAMSPVSPGERGRAAPFPSRPVLQSRAATQPGLGPGLAARVKVERYRDLYAIQIPPTPAGARGPPSDDDVEVDIHVEDFDEGDDEEREEIIGVIGRFQDRPREQPGRGLERNDSTVLRPGRGRLSPSAPGNSPGPRFADDTDDESQYPDEDKTAGRSTMYRYEGGRETMYSEYSRASFLNVEKSAKAHTQLLDRVGVMFDLSGRERSAIPPVPKLSPALAAGAVGNKF